MAFWSARLAEGSGPPSLAATMIARESFEKSLPRFASAAPFLCLIDDHLLWPAIATSVRGGGEACPAPLGAHQIEEARVHAQIVRQLRVEGREQQAAVADENGLLAELADDLHVRPEGTNARRADEDAVKRDLVADQRDVRLEAPDLASVCIAVDLEVGEPEMVAVEHDHPGARPEDGRLEAPDRVVEAVQLGELDDRRRLSARDSQAVEPGQVRGLAHLDRFRAEALERAHVLPERPLQREHTDPERRLHGREV